MNRLHEKGSAQLKYSLISNALCPVLDIDDATALKAVFRQNMLHNFVIPIFKRVEKGMFAGFSSEEKECFYSCLQKLSGNLEQMLQQAKKEDWN